MERLAVLFVLAGLLLSCSPEGRADYQAWDQDFANAPKGFRQAVTGLWVSSYREDAHGQFTRETAWGQVPEKLVPDSEGGYTVAVPLLVQGETSDGPLPDRFWTVLVRVVRMGDRFSFVPNDALPGKIVGWYDEGRRTVWFRGKLDSSGPNRTIWQFQGRY